MAEWTPEATEYLEGYLKQVHALAKSADLDADEIVQGLREHIDAKVAEHAQTLLPIDVLVALLAEVGTPQQIIATGVPVSTPSATIPQAAAPRRNRRSFAVAMVLVLLAIAVVGVPVVAVGTYLATARQGASAGVPVRLEPLSNERTTVDVPVATPEEGERVYARSDIAAVTSVLRKITVAQSRFVDRRLLDEDKDGISDFGSLVQLSEAGELEYGIVAIQLTCEPYLLNLVTIPSASPGGPSYTCEAVCIPADPLRPTIRLDSSGAITEVKPLVETIFPDEKAR